MVALSGVGKQGDDGHSGAGARRCRIFISFVTKLNHFHINSLIEKTITLDDETFLPDGYRVKLHLILEPGEALQLGGGSGIDMTPEEIAEFEEMMTFFHGYPFKIPEKES